MRFRFNQGAPVDGYAGVTVPKGTVTMKKLKGLVIPSVDGDITLSEIKEFALPHNGLEPEMKDWKFENQDNINRGLEKILIAKEYGIPTFWGTLWMKKITADGEEINYGLVSLRVVTDAGVNYMAQTTMAGTAQSWPFKYHGLGTGTTAESAANTALVTELTTEYNPDNTRATGTQENHGTNGAIAANVYQTVATNTIDSGTPAVTEHGVFSAASAGTLLDRSVFAAINLSSGDALQSTYQFTLTSGG